MLKAQATRGDPELAKLRWKLAAAKQKLLNAKDGDTFDKTSSRSPAGNASAAAVPAPMPELHPPTQ